MGNEKNKYYMRMALEEAQKAGQRDEVPIGAVIVEAQSGEIIAACGNETVSRHDPSAHAEILAMRQACSIKKAQRIPEMDIYITLEPCPMCAAALSYARIRRIYIGAQDPKSGGVLNGPRIYDSPAIHHKPEIIQGAFEEESSLLLKDFFGNKRAEKKRR